MPKTLLLADDSVTIQKVVGITFANEDVELVTVDNGDDALVRARQLKPDLVLADIGMPGLNGYELCGAIRRDPQLGHVPVLLLTGTFETYDEERAREVGASGHIAKPFEAQALVDRVFALLAQAAAAPPAAPVARPAPPAVAQAPRPAPAAAPRPAQAPPQSPRAPAPPQTARPAPAAPPPPAAQAPAAAPRPRPDLPPVPGTAMSRPAPRPAPTPRPSAPFEFELPGEPASAPAPVAPVAAPARPPEPPAAPTPVGEAVWEAEPELEAVDETPMRRASTDENAAGPDATRLFAPDLLGRPGRIPESPPEVPEPPAPPASSRGDFSFGDLDFEEPTGSPANPGHSQIFGDSLGGGGEPMVLAEPAPLQPAETEALADPLYSQTRFLDPHAGAPPAHFDTPNPAAAPPLPDLLAGEEITHPSDGEDEPELAEADLEPEPLDEDPLAQPFSPETQAALSAPEFAPLEASHQPVARPDAATRLMLDSDIEPPQDDEEELALEAADELPDQPRRPLPELDTAPSLSVPAPPPRPMPAPTPIASPTASTAVTLPAPDARPAPAPVHTPVAPMIDSAQLAQVVEKVAWEAFGALSEQVVGEVMKRVEAVVWEVVPQLCERLIRDEIARLKAELPE